MASKDTQIFFPKSALIPKYQLGKGLLVQAKPGNHPGLTPLLGRTTNCLQSPFQSTSSPSHSWSTFKTYLERIHSPQQAEIFNHQETTREGRKLYAPLPRPSSAPPLRFPLQPYVTEPLHLPHLCMPFASGLFLKLFLRLFLPRQSRSTVRIGRCCYCSRGKPKTRRGRGWANAPALNTGNSFLRYILHSSSKGPQRCWAQWLTEITSSIRPMSLVPWCFLATIYQISYLYPRLFSGSAFKGTQTKTVVDKCSSWHLLNN